MHRDNTPAVHLASWDLEADYFDNDFLSGTVPVLFSSSPAATEAAMRADPAQAFKDLEAINRRFFVPETIDVEEGLRVIKKPRLGDCDYAFKNNNLERLFSDYNSTRATGTLLYCIKLSFCFPLIS